MRHSRIKWTAVTLFTALLTVAEVVALQAAARDARRWLASDSARGIQEAGRAVAAVVSASRGAGLGACPGVRVKGANGRELRAALAEAKAHLREARKAREAKRVSSRDEI